MTVEQHRDSMKHAARELYFDVDPFWSPTVSYGRRLARWLAAPEEERLAVEEHWRLLGHSNPFTA